MHKDGDTVTIYQVTIGDNTISLTFEELLVLAKVLNQSIERIVNPSMVDA